MAFQTSPRRTAPLRGATSLRRRGAPRRATARRTTSAQRTLIGLLLIPLLSLVALWGFTASVTLSDVDNNQQSNTIINTIGPSIQGLSHTFEAERGFTLAWLASGRGSAALHAQLLAARQADDASATAATSAAASVRGLLSDTAKQQLTTLDADLAKLAGLRTAVDSGTDSLTAAYTAYSAIDSVIYGFAGNATTPADPTLNLMVQAATEEARAAGLITGASDLLTGVLQAPGAQLTPADQVLLAQIVAGQDMAAGNSLSFSPPQFEGLVGQIFDSPAYQKLTTAEDRVIGQSAGRRVALDPAVLQSSIQAIGTAQLTVLPQLGGILAARTAQLHNNLLNELYLAGGLGLIAVVASLFVAVRFGRRFRGELTRLYDSARQMAEQRLPRLAERLRNGDEVDVAAETPPLREGRITETASVARAFSTVYRTAVEAAVGQANLRNGLNQVFISLSLRSQSLLHRQLSMLDEMERATSDSAVLGDLFRLDHLTTRMRRHAEGLIILAGSSPGRTWNEPVLLTDVLNAAIAEVEDYVRVEVVAELPDAVAGTAVNDVIHLFAELIENATSFSPPSSRVEVRSEVVGHGLAVQIEDRGLGMPPPELAAINERLASPPEFDLANTDQLGLFVAARLAKRHGVKISLRESSFGGTTAIVLLPQEIIIPAMDGGLVRDTGAANGLPGMPAAVNEPAFGSGGGAGPFGDIDTFGRHRRLNAVPGGVVTPIRPAPPALEAVRRELPARSPSPASGQPPWEIEREDQPPAGFGGGPAGGSSGRGPAAFNDGSRPGLPRRTRGTNIAPSLRRDPGAAAGGGEGPAAAAGPVDPAWSERSPEEAGTLLSALQDGWERARVEESGYPDWEG